MKKVKKAKKVVFSVELHCPYCGAELTAPSGALVWEVAEIETGKRVSCVNCTQAVELPKA